MSESGPRINLSRREPTDEHAVARLSAGAEARPAGDERAPDVCENDGGLEPPFSASQTPADDGPADDDAATSAPADDLALGTKPQVRCYRSKCGDISLAAFVVALIMATSTDSVVRSWSLLTGFVSTVAALAWLVGSEAGTSPAPQVQAWSRQRWSAKALGLQVASDHH
jgi:hypothetical protein